MRRSIPSSLTQILVIVFFVLIGYLGNSQIVQVEIVGGAIVTQGSTVTINAGSSLDFRITNIDASNCNGSKRLKIRGVDISNTSDFDITPNNPKKNIKQVSCGGIKNKYLDFEIENTNGSCATTSTLVTIEVRNQADFTFTLEVNSSPIMSVLGGTPSADILNGSTTTSAVNGTYFGVVNEGVSVTRNYTIVNTGSCPLDITGLSTTVVTGSGFSVTPLILVPPSYNLATAQSPTVSVSPGSFVVVLVTFTAPAGTGIQEATINILNNYNTTYSFNVEADLFDFDIPGPGGITADFRLWLKSTRGVVTSGSDVTDWLDLGTNGKSATADSGKEPTYLDTASDNINFNPVVKFENDGASVEQYMYNVDNGFYSQDIFIVMIPDANMNSSSTRNTVFAGVDSGSAGDMTGIGFGDYSSEFTNETLSYNQDIPGGGSFYGEGEIGSTYSGAGIINVRNNAVSSPTGQDILYNSITLTTSTEDDIGFSNVGYIDTAPDPDVVYGTEFWIGKNFDVQGSLNGRVAEIFTFAERVADNDRQKIESYLAIKYGITLGATTEAQKDYINSFGTKVWDITANSGYNYHVAGIGRDSISDLNQKQSKTLNTTNEVTIGLNGIFTTNSTNTNEFKKDGDFLVWGCNNAAFTTSGQTEDITVNSVSGVTTSVTMILRQWKIVESVEDVDGDVENVFISIPPGVFSGFALGTDEEYALIVADNAAFTDTDIVDVIPLKTDAYGNLSTWYDFDGTKYFTFGKVSKLSGTRTVNIASGDYLIGEYALNLNIDAFTISAWVKSASNASTRTVMAKGEKLQIRLNSSDQVEVMVDDTVTPRFTSTMALDDGKWHQITFVYSSGTVFFYIDGVLDKSEQNVEPPTPNFNRFALGALYVDKNTITNPFLGEIDEVYVWDQELTEDQIHYLMNQEIEKVSGDYVSGKIIPTAASSNEVASIPWSKLKAYYDFNSFYGTTVEGLTDDQNYLRLKYLDKDKDFVDDQTAPLPYVSAANGAWDLATTWSNNADQVVPNSLSLDGSTIIDWNIVEISNDITSGDRDISLLGLIQTSGTLTIADPTDPQDETNSGQGLTISHYLELDGVIDLVGESQLIQTEGSIVDADSGGYIERDQQGTANAFNYNYWSSSVGPISGNTGTRGTGVSSVNNNYTLSEVLKNGTDSNDYTNLNFVTSPNGSNSTPSGDSRTISTYWLYTFYGESGDYGSWNGFNETSSIQAGEGFTMKGTSGSVSIDELQNYVFKGLPNNGDITLALDKISGTDDVDRLIGNPYPSAIDATQFILDNLSIADGGNNPNGNIFNGALYFWDHFGQENSHYLSGYVGGYATRNLTGGSIAISNDSRINNTSDEGSAAEGTKVPGEYIPVNQGFFVSTALDGFDNDEGTSILTVDGGDVVFKNSQRLYVTEDGSSSLFLKSLNTKKTNSTAKIDDSKTPTIKLMYDSPLGYHRQIVVGVKEKATNKFDLGYDAFMADVNIEDMYWVFDNNEFVIQGVNNFEASQELAIGLIVKKSGLASIKIDVLENIDPNKAIYISDNVTGEVFQINSKPFEIYLETGTYNNRFKLVFYNAKNSKSLQVEDLENSNNLLVFYDSKASKLKIFNKDSVYASLAKLYNILGQSIMEFDINSKKDMEIPLSVKKGAYIVKLETENGLVSKKIIIE
ncbi:LamG-like jellyroll fold domain-containing protein [Thalassobellus sediminis]|uniref:LamG-like jellyroll fold domain-containing protein n=1 Tax=Thalassobellus sediminis TaxID=3367753 RepID=UPI0037B7F04A